MHNAIQKSILQHITNRMRNVMVIMHIVMVIMHNVMIIMHIYRTRLHNAT